MIRVDIRKITAEGKLKIFRIRVNAIATKAIKTKVFHLNSCNVYP